MFDLMPLCVWGLMLTTTSNPWQNFHLVVLSLQLIVSIVMSTHIIPFSTCLIFNYVTVSWVNQPVVCMSHNSPLNIFHRLPPEAIVKNVFTLKSDVWSYGITLWEMFSFGQQPWAELNFNQVQSVLGIFWAIFSPFEKSTFQKISRFALPKLTLRWMMWGIQAFCFGKACMYQGWMCIMQKNHQI